MSVFAEPLAQARAYIKLRRITRARSEALAALDLIEQRAKEMETELEAAHRQVDDVRYKLNACLSARERRQP